MQKSDQTRMLSELNDLLTCHEMLVYVTMTKNLKLLWGNVNSWSTLHIYSHAHTMHTLSVHISQ